MCMKAILAIALILGLLAAGCIQPPGTGNNTTVAPPANNTTSVPPGYDVKDYCEEDGDCVRLNKCCDCGLGEYVNAYNQENPECTGPQCKCAVALSHGECQDNKCVAVAGGGNEPGNGTVTPPTGFCGRSTNGPCSGNLDCMSGGCSGQVCQSASEPPVITTCEYTECYNARTYGLTCGCSAGKCQWR